MQAATPRLCYLSATMTDRYPLTDEQIAAYRRDGFIQLDDVVTPAELTELRDAVETAVREESINQDPNRPKSSYEQIFIQKVNLWRRHPDVAKYVLRRRFGDIAARLAGTPMRIWHDQALFKEPRTGANTPWHQDTVYWPHEPKELQTTLWLALKDTTIQNGCMSFLPGTHKLQGIEPVNLAEPQDLYKVAPQTRGLKPVARELKAGSCTFHNGLTFHYAGPNRSDGMREALAIIYMPTYTTYTGADHMVTNHQGFKVGDTLEGELFPLVSA